jgi:hypothetical protein
MPDALHRREGPSALRVNLLIENPPPQNVDAPPCMRQRLFPLTAEDMQGLPERVLAPQRRLYNIGPVLRECWPVIYLICAGAAREPSWLDFASGPSASFARTGNMCNAQRRIR